MMIFSPWATLMWCLDSWKRKRSLERLERQTKLLHEFLAIHRDEDDDSDKKIIRLKKLARKMNQHKWIAHSFLGNELKKIGRYEEALKYFLTEDLFTQAADVCHLLGRDKEALKYLTRAQNNGVRLGPHEVLLEAEVRANLGERESVPRLLRLAYCRTPDDEKTAEIDGRIQAISEKFSVPVSLRL